MTRHPMITPNNAIGNPMMTAKGEVQLSYCAARIRNATRIARIKIIVVVDPALSSW